MPTLAQRLRGFLGRFALPRNSGTRNPMQWFIDWVRDGNESDSGVSVNGKTCLGYAPVWQATNILAGDIGKMPLNVWRQVNDDTRVPAEGHPAHRLLMRRPNFAMNVGVFKETITAHALLWGNGRAGIVRDGDGRPVQLVPFLPDRSYSEVVNGKLFHFTKLGQSNTYTPFADEHVLHIKGLGFDGVSGYSVITLARNSWGLGMGQEKFGNRLLKNNARPSVVLETPGRFTETDARQILKDWETMQAGLENAGRTALLQNGLKANPLAINPTDAQWLEGRKFQRVEVASWFNLPPHKLGDDSSDGYNSLEQREGAYLGGTLMRWINTWEEECEEKLLTEREKRSGKICAEFDTAALLRGDELSRYRVYQIGIASTILSPNDCRRREGLNPRPGGDEYQNPNTSSSREQGTGHREQEADAAAAATAKAMRREAAVSRLEEILNIEAKRVQDAARKPTTFCRWLDGFYAAGRFSDTLARVVASLGGDPALAVEHCEQSRGELLEAAGRATPEKLAAEVARVVAAWPTAAYDLADALEDDR